MIFVSIPRGMYLPRDIGKIKIQGISSLDFYFVCWNDTVSENIFTDILLADKDFDRKHNSRKGSDR